MCVQRFLCGSEPELTNCSENTGKVLRVGRGSKEHIKLNSNVAFKPKLIYLELALMSLRV